MKAQSWRPIAASAAILMILAACGTRVDESIRRRAAAAALGGQSGVAPGGVGETPGAALGGAQPGTAGGGTGPAGASAPIGATGAPAGNTGGGVPAPAGGNGGATDIGVTATSITLGNVVVLSGPVPGLFEGAADGAHSYFSYINSQGGVFGRQLLLRVADDQFDCGENQNQHNALIPKVFGFVGSFSVYDDCGAKVLDKHRDVPDVAYALSPEALNLPNNFSPYPLVQGYPTGMFRYWKSKYGDAIRHVGTLAADVPAARAAWAGIKAAAESVGWRFTYERYYGATEQDFTADAVRMRSQAADNRVDIVFLISADIATTARIKNAVDAQTSSTWKPIFVLPIAYDKTFIERLDGGKAAAEGVVGSNLFSLFFAAADARNIPEVALFQRWMARTHPDKPLDLFAMFGWGSAVMFVQALKAAGARATRAGVMTQLRKIHEFSANGLISPSDPAGKTPSKCYALWRIHNGIYERVDTPPDRYRCDANFYRLPT
jgi:ABC-type branched-subunit amino acid transport system substrate-binding protein